jgi:plasmid stability protein
MARVIQIRHVPDNVHRKLKARAALAGMSLSDYLLAEIRRSLERPTQAEMLQRLAGRRPARLPQSAASLVRAERDRR